MRIPRLIATIAFVLVLAALACKKYNFNGVVPPASVTVVHAMPTGSAILPFFGVPPAQYWATRVQIGYGGSALFSPPKDSNALLIVPYTDTAFTIFQEKLPLVSGGIYTLFLAGDTTHPDTLLKKEDIPYYTDSLAGARFVNCAVGGKSLKVSLALTDSTSQVELGSLGYMQLSDFKTYPANGAAGGSYKFIISDAASGDSLTEYTWAYTLYKNNTLVISGSQDPTSATPLMVFSVNHF